MFRSRFHIAAEAAILRCCRQRRHYTRSGLVYTDLTSSPYHQKAKVSFIDDVNDQMERDYPQQYERYLESKRAYDLRKGVQNEDARLHKLNDRVIIVAKMSDEKLWQKTETSGAEEMPKTPQEKGKIETTWFKKLNQLETIQTQEEKFHSSDDTPKRGSTISLIVDKDKGKSEKKSSIFSSISKSALCFKDGGNSTTIPLAELFPTLYAKEIKNSTTLSSNGDINNTTCNADMIYDAKLFDAYREAMTAVMSNEKIQRTIYKLEKKGEVHVLVIEKLKEWLLSHHRVIDEEVVEDRWSNLEKHWREGWIVCGASSLMEGDKAESSVMEAELKAQNALFRSKLLLEEYMTIDEEEEARQTFNQIAQLYFSALGRFCAERARPVPLEVAWYKVKESGLILPRDSISTYLYVVGTMGMGDSFRTTLWSTSGGDKDQSPFKKKNGQSISEEVATYHDLTMKPTESSISLRVKAFASKGDAKTALDLLESFKKMIRDDVASKEAIRLRTYLPILKHYCEVKDVAAALVVFKQMQSTSTVILEPENYVLLLASIAENGYFCNDSPQIEGALDLGLKYTCGPELFDELVSQMANDVLEISSASASRLHNALAIGFKDQTKNKLKEMHPLASMPLTRQPAQGDELVACKISLDRFSGICPVTKAQNRLLVLEPSQRRQLHDDLLKLSREQFVNFAGRRQDETAERAAEELQKFSDWLDERDGEPFTAILDGANIGYFMQSFDKGRFNYHQIKFMVDTLEERGENVLVVIPNKYGHNSFYTSKTHHQVLDEEERSIMKDLLRKKKLYKVPPRCLDDFYWMLASVSDQISSSKGADLSVPNNDPNGRWPGVRPVLISNDQMRDHKWDLLDPRLFRRWYGCHIVNYNFTAFVMGECVAGNEVFFSQADFFSREIQGNQTADGKVWHFPVSDWDLEERFVVRL